MAFSYCLTHPLPLKVNCCIGQPTGFQHNAQERRFASALKSMSTTPLGQQGRIGADLYNDWTFLRGSRVVLTPKFSTHTNRRRSFGVYASCRLTTSEIASNAFTLGTAAVLPLYALMVFAPKAEQTKKLMESRIPYVLLGLIYAYQFYLSWTPDTFRLLFASKYWLPELPGMAKMFSSEMTLASAWLHLLDVDLFAARQIFLDGLENQVETRHSVTLCLFFCPIGIVSHVITRALSGSNRRPH